MIDLLRPDRPNPAPLRNARYIFLPLPAAGELFAGAHYSDRQDENLAKVEEVVAMWSVLHPDLHTARVYGRLRGSAHQQLSTSRVNDLWIAALCIQHDLPLLTNDGGFDQVPGLRTIHW
ncbi:MAG TPA: PIN domain-containing protein [Thermoanaerobaculia bacterium]